MEVHRNPDLCSQLELLQIRVRGDHAVRGGVGGGLGRDGGEKGSVRGGGGRIGNC